MGFLKDFVSTNNNINENVVFSLAAFVCVIIMFLLGKIGLITPLSDTELGLFFGFVTGSGITGTVRANAANKLGGKSE